MCVFTLICSHTCVFNLICYDMCVLVLVNFHFCEHHFDGIVEKLLLIEIEIR